MAKHTILGGKVHVYKRPNSRFWQCASFLNGKMRRTSTKEESLSLAKEFAEDWYLRLAGKIRYGGLKNEKTFKQAADRFTIEYETITEGQRSPEWVRGHKDRLRLHLLPFFGELGLSEVTAGKVQEYRLHRIKNAVNGKPPAHKTLHNELVTLRQTLKTAVRHGWLSHVPDMSSPYRAHGKVEHRPWFSPKEYKQLYEATRKRAKELKQSNHRRNAEDLHDFVLFMANTGLRPDEVYNIEHRDIADYHAVDHGYATTIHKAQGTTVDRTYVMASRTMDRHLTYVAMTRHREGAKIYASREEFTDMEALSSRLGRSGVKETSLDYLGGGRAKQQSTGSTADDWWKPKTQPTEDLGNREKRLKAERERLIAEQIERFQRERNEDRDRER